jgi:hypothetical protein
MNFSLDVHKRKLYKEGDELFFDCYWRKLFGEECDSWDVSFFATWAHFLNQVAFIKN